MRWLLLLPLTGCVTLIEEHDAPIGEVVRDCVVPGVTEPPVSLEYDDHSRWIWEDASAIGGCEVTLEPPVLGLSDEEVAANAARTDGKQLALRPTGGVVADDVGYLYYEHVLRGPGLFDEEVLGTALCVLDGDGCARVSPDVMWTPDTRALNRGGLVVGDRAVIAGCRSIAPLDDPCTLSSVAVADLRDPAAYETVAWEVVNNAGAVTLAPFEDGYALVTMDIFEAAVDVRRSDTADRDYGHAVTAFEVAPPEEWFVRGGREHRALREGPRELVVSYGNDDGVHLATFRSFEGSWE